MGAHLERMLHDGDCGTLARYDAVGVQVDPHSHQKLGYTYGDVGYLLKYTDFFDATETELGRALR